MQGLEPESPSPLQWFLTSKPQPHAWSKWVIYRVNNDNNDFRTFNPVAFMIVGKAKINALDHFGSVDSIEERTCMGWGLKLSILHQLPTTAKREILCCWSNCLGLTGHSEEFRMRYLRWQELVNVNYEQISSLRLQDQTEICFGERIWQANATNDKNSRQL